MKGKKPQDFKGKLLFNFLVEWQLRAKPTQLARISVRKIILLVISGPVTKAIGTHQGWDLPSLGSQTGTTV